MSLKRSSVDPVADVLAPDSSPALAGKAGAEFPAPAPGHDNGKNTSGWRRPVFTAALPIFKAAALALCLCLLWPAEAPAAGKSGCYDILYFKDGNFENILKYQQKLSGLLGTKIGKKLKIVATDRQYGLVYNRSGSAFSIAKIVVHQSEILRRAGLEEPSAIKQKEYQELDKAATGKEPAEPIQAMAGKAAATRISAKFTDDSSIENHLENFLDNLRRNGKIDRDELTGFLVYDLTEDARVVNINVEKPFQAASMIKPFVALAFFHRVKGGRLSYGPEARAKMEAMIQHSSNPATNWVMKNIGGPAAIQRILHENYGQIFRTTEVREYIPAGGRTYANRASPEDYGRFLRALWQEELPSSKEISRLMALPGRDRLCYGTSIPQDTMVFNKTGSTAHLCGDMGILVARGRDGRPYPYAIVGIIEKKTRPSDYGHWKATRSNVIREVSSLVYAEMRKKYDLL